DFALGWRRFSTMPRSREPAAWPPAPSGIVPPTLRPVAARRRAAAECSSLCPGAAVLAARQERRGHRLPAWPETTGLAEVHRPVPWDYRPLLTELASQVGSELGQPDAVLVFDPPPPSPRREPSRSAWLGSGADALADWGNHAGEKSGR